jgi:hypothetical protein
LSNVIKAAKNLHYNKLISNSNNNKIITTWSSIKTVTCTRINNTEVQFLNVVRKLTNNQHLITDSLNNHFLTTVDKINVSNAKGGYTIEFHTDKHWS